MSDIYDLRYPAGSEKTFDMDTVRKAAYDNQLIGLIKLYRRLSGLGLKQSKDKIEEFMVRDNTNYNHKYDVEGLVNAFKEFLIVEEPYTKEQFLHLIENAIDNMEALQYTDMVEAVTQLLSNVRRKGGLEVIAKESNDFLRNI